MRHGARLCASQAPGAEDLGITVLVTEGFGDIAMADAERLAMRSVSLQLLRDAELIPARERRPLLASPLAS